MPLGGLERSGGSPGRALGPAGVWTADKWLSPTTRPSGLTDTNLQSGLLRAHAAGLWLTLGSPVRAPPQGRLSGTARPFSPGWKLARQRSAPPSVIQAPPPPRCSGSPRDVPTRVRGRRKVCHLPGAACHLSAAWGSLGTRGRCLPGDAPSSLRPVGRSAEQEARSAEPGLELSEAEAGG